MNILNAQEVAKSYGTTVLLDGVSLGLEDRDRVGVVGRNGGGKTTLVELLAGVREPDRGRVTHSGSLRVGLLAQSDELDPSISLRRAIVGDRAEHEWATLPGVRDVLDGLGLRHRLDAVVGELSGGERRRTALAALLVRDLDLLVLDEPTNHLDVEGVAWLAAHLAARRHALLVVTHDRWFLDEVCTRTWEVADGTVHSYEGGYSSYVLARAERERVASAREARRANLLRKELAWLRRGPPARTSKPRFRIEAAASLIADEPAPRDRVALQSFAAARLGRSVLDAEEVTVRLGGRTLLDRMTWRLGPGDRVGVVGVNGSGKTTLLRLLAGDLPPDAGTVRRGRTVRAAYLDQQVRGLDPALRVLESVEEVARSVDVGGRELSAGVLLERFGFASTRQWTPVSDLSGGERRRLQLLRLLMTGPNVLLLDEPTNDLDIDTLTAFEDLLDGWPGTLVVVSHDRYFVERVCDSVVALLGDGSLAALPGGVEEYLQRRAAAAQGPADRPRDTRAGDTRAGDARAGRRELARLERVAERLSAREADLHRRMAEVATDHEQVLALDAELRAVVAEREAAEEAWLALADG